MKGSPAHWSKDRTCCKDWLLVATIEELRILVGLKVRQYFNKSEKAIRIIEVSEKLEIAAAGQNSFFGQC